MVPPNWYLLLVIYCTPIDRLVVEEDTGPIVYYTTDNSRVYQAKELQILPIRAEVDNCFHENTSFRMAL